MAGPSGREGLGSLSCLPSRKKTKDKGPAGTGTRSAPQAPDRQQAPPLRSALPTGVIRRAAVRTPALDGTSAQADGQPGPEISAGTPVLHQDRLGRASPEPRVEHPDIEPENRAWTAALRSDGTATAPLPQSDDSVSVDEVIDSPMAKLLMSGESGEAERALEQPGTTPAAKHLFDLPTEIIQLILGRLDSVDRRLFAETSKLARFHALPSVQNLLLPSRWLAPFRSRDPAAQALSRELEEIATAYTRSGGLTVSGSNFDSKKLHLLARSGLSQRITRLTISGPWPARSDDLRQLQEMGILKSIALTLNSPDDIAHVARLCPNVTDLTVTGRCAAHHLTDLPKGLRRLSFKCHPAMTAEGLAPLAGCAHLESLEIADTGHLPSPAGLVFPPHLKRLSWKGSLLPAECLPQLKELQVLELDATSLPQLKKVPPTVEKLSIACRPIAPDLGDMPTELDLSACEPGDLDNLGALTSFTMANVLLTGGDFLDALPAGLEELCLPNTRGFTVPEFKRNVDRMRLLKLDASGIPQARKVDYSNHPTLKDLNLDRTPSEPGASHHDLRGRVRPTELAPDLLLRLCENPNIERLSLQDNGVDTESVAALATMPALRSLRLGRNALATDDIAALSRSETIFRLDLTDTGLTDASVDDLKDMAETRVLRELDVSRNPRLTAQGLQPFATVHKLRVMRDGRMEVALQALPRTDSSRPDGSTGVE